jgi:hypothetical protein
MVFTISSFIYSKSINQFLFLLETQCLYCGVEIDVLFIVCMDVVLKIFEVI